MKTPIESLEDSIRWMLNAKQRIANDTLRLLSEGKTQEDIDASQSKLDSGIAEYQQAIEKLKL